MPIRDLYSATLDAKQVRRALEEYVLRANPDKTLSAKAEYDGKSVNVRVSTKRKPRDKAAEAKMAGTRG